MITYKRAVIIMKKVRMDLLYNYNRMTTKNKSLLY